MGKGPAACRLPCSPVVSFLCRGQGWRQPEGAKELENRAGFQQSTIWVCVSRENTGGLLEKPFSSWYHLEKENIAAYLKFSELEVWIRTPG